MPCLFTNIKSSLEKEKLTLRGKVVEGSKGQSVNIYWQIISEETSGEKNS